MLDKTRGVIVGRTGRSRVVQQADHRTGAGLGGEPGQGAFARLAGTVESDHTGVGHRFGQEFLSPTGNQLLDRLHHSSMTGPIATCGHLAACQVDIWSLTGGHLAGTTMVI